MRCSVRSRFIGPWLLLLSSATLDTARVSALRSTWGTNSTKTRTVPCLFRKMARTLTPGNEQADNRGFVRCVEKLVWMRDKATTSNLLVHT